MNFSQLASADTLSRCAGRFPIYRAQIVPGLRVVVEELWKCLFFVEPNNGAVNGSDHPLTCIGKNAASTSRIGQPRNKAISLEYLGASQTLESFLRDVASLFAAIFKNTFTDIASLNQPDATFRLIFALDPITITKNFAKFGKRLCLPPSIHPIASTACNTSNCKE